MRTTTATLALAATTALIGLGTTTATALAPAETAAPQPVRERGILLQCTGEAAGHSAFVELYENDPYLNRVEVVIDEDPTLAMSREPRDLYAQGEIRTGVTIAGKPARITGTAKRVGPKKRVHEVYDDAGEQIVADGYHRRLAYDVTLRYDGASFQLTCDPAFYYNLKVTRTDITGD